jgi:protoheme ferro-lyase
MHCAPGVVLVLLGGPDTMNLTQEQLAKVTPDHPIFEVMERMNLIQQKMAQNDPEISTHLKSIWKHLQTYEELAHLLTPEQIGVLMKGMQKHTAIQLVVETPAKGRKKTKPSVDDLI